MKFKWIVILIGIVLVTLSLVSSVVTFGQESLWSGQSVGLSVFQNEEMKTAGLSFVVKAQDWPHISLRGGVKGKGSSYIIGSNGIELGKVKISDDDNGSLSGEIVDWTHNEMTFSSPESSELKLWISRLSPAILVQSSSSTLRLLSGDVTGYTFDGSTVSNRLPGPAYPKYIAYSSGGTLQIEALSTAALTLSSNDNNWILLWYGENSHFVETKTPLSYTGSKTHYPGVPAQDAYQADVPLLLVFEHQPTTVKHSEEGGVDISFPTQAGYVSLTPIWGRDHLLASKTEAWSQGIPADLEQKVQWWADRLCQYPISVSETYTYQEETDIVIIGEDITYLSVCSSSATFAPIPPMLSIAKDSLDVNFSASIVNTDLTTEFGPIMGIDNATAYSWSISGLKKYSDAHRVIAHTGQAPFELDQELVSEVEKIISSGHFAPWAVSDGLPNKGDFRGDIYWLNPGDILYHLTEIVDVLPEGTRADLIDYIKTERSVYPPEDIYNLDLDEGTVRGAYSVNDPKAFERFQEYRTDVFLNRVPIYNLYALSNYYKLTGDTIDTQTWQKTNEILDQNMSEQDWATFYWFDGFDETRPVAVINASRHFAGLIGFIRLAQMMGDIEAEALGRALFAKAAVLRMGISTYPRYLYSANLIELPPEPSWQVDYTTGKWSGYIFNYDWTGPYDDARQVRTVNQFGVSLSDHSAYTEPWNESTWAYFTAYRDMVPELARFFVDNAKQDSMIYLNKVEDFFPHWYVAFAEGILGGEQNLTHPIDSFQLFMAKALLQQVEPEKLEDYIDIPWIQTGDFFYVHKLAETIKAYKGYSWETIPYEPSFVVNVTPPFHAIDIGGTAEFTIQIQPRNGFTSTVSIVATSPSSDLILSLNPPTIIPPGESILSINDTHPISSTEAFFYNIPITTIGGDIIKTTSVGLVINGFQIYLPIIISEK